MSLVLQFFLTTDRKTRRRSCYVHPPGLLIFRGQPYWITFIPTGTNNYESCDCKALSPHRMLIQIAVGSGLCVYGLYSNKKASI